MHLDRWSSVVLTLQVVEGVYVFVHRSVMNRLSTGYLNLYVNTACASKARMQWCAFFVHIFCIITPFDSEVLVACQLKLCCLFYNKKIFGFQVMLFSTLYIRVTGNKSPYCTRHYSDFSNSCRTAILQRINLGI